MVEGILVNVEKVGDEKRKLVILPGWKAGSGEWMGVAANLGENYSVYVLELPGMGGSGLPPESWGIGDYFRFTVKFLEKLGINRCIVLGHSFGGRVGLLLAARTSLVEKLILVDAAGMEIKSAREKLLSWLMPVGKLMPESWRNMMRSDDYKKAGPMRGNLARIVNEPLESELSQIKVPTLIIWGERDHVLSIAEAKMLKKGIENSVMRIVWGADHWPHAEKYEEFMELLREEGT